MILTVKKGLPSKQVIVASILLLVLAASVGIIGRIRQQRQLRVNQPEETASALLSQYGVSPLLAPIIRLPVTSDASDAIYLSALRQYLAPGPDSVVSSTSRELMGGSYVIRITRLSDWRATLGELKADSGSNEHLSVLALILDPGMDSTFLHEVERLCLEEQVKLVLLAASQ
jgi:hypothetical protein